MDPAWEPRPCCPYGLSKVVVEALGRLHAELTGAFVVCLRPGATPGYRKPDLDEAALLRPTSRGVPGRGGRRAPGSG